MAVAFFAATLAAAALFKAAECEGGKANNDRNNDYVGYHFTSPRTYDSGGR